MVIREYGSTDRLELAEVEKPVPRPNQVLIEIHATSVNPVDWKFRLGKLKAVRPLQFPAVLGFDVCGQVVEKGTQATRFSAGDWVYARSNTRCGDAYAEYVALDQDVVALKPESMSHEEAACVPLAALTALQALRDKGGISSGDEVLINGASGGVGGYAVQIAKAMSATVTGVCSTANASFVKALGADEIIDYKTADPLLPGNSYSIIFDTIGSLSYSAARKSLRPRGVFLMIAHSPGKLLASMLMSAVVPGKKAGYQLCRSNGDDLDYLRKLTEEGKLRTEVDSSFSLDEVAKAHERSQTFRVRGKVAVRVR